MRDPPTQRKKCKTPFAKKEAKQDRRSLNNLQTASTNNEQTIMSTEDTDGQQQLDLAPADADDVLEDEQEVVVDEKTADDEAAVEAAVQAAGEEASALISEAAAAAVAAAVGESAGVTHDEATIAALNVGVKDADNDHDEPGGRRNEQRRKRYREAKIGKDGEVMMEEASDDDDDLDEKGAKRSQTHEAQLAARRLKDRERYAKMTCDQRQGYNAKRREQYHRQSEVSRVKRRERERTRYHSLDNETAKDRNARRARLERERYQKLTPEELEAKNRRRRERAALARQKKEAAAAAAVATAAGKVGDTPVVVEAAKAEDDVVSV